MKRVTVELVCAFRSKLISFQLQKCLSNSPPDVLMLCLEETLSFTGVECVIYGGAASGDRSGCDYMCARADRFVKHCVSVLGRVCVSVSCTQQLLQDGKVPSRSGKI